MKDKFNYFVTILSVTLLMTLVDLLVTLNNNL